MNVLQCFEDILSLDEVEEIHDFHIWAISQGKMAMSGHIRALDPHLAVKKATAILRDKYEIFHSTIQIEKVHPGVQPGCCDNDHDDHNHELTADGVIVKKHGHTSHNHENHGKKHNHDHKHENHDHKKDAHDHSHKNGDDDHKHDENQEE